MNHTPQGEELRLRNEDVKNLINFIMKQNEVIARLKKKAFYLETELNNLKLK